MISKFEASMPTCLMLQFCDFGHGRAATRQFSGRHSNPRLTISIPRAVISNAEEQRSNRLFSRPPELMNAHAEAAHIFSSAREQPSIHSSPQVDSIGPLLDHVSSIVSSLWALAEQGPAMSQPIGNLVELTDLINATKSALAQADVWPTGSLAAVLEALSRLRIKDSELLSPLCTALTQRAQQAEDWNPGTTLKLYSSLATLRMRPSVLVGALAMRLEAPLALESLRLPGLQRLFKSLSILQWPVSAKELNLIGNIFLSYYRVMPAADTAELVWVIARRGDSPETLLTAFVPAVHAALPRCRMKHLADISRAYAKFPAAAVGGVFESIAARAAQCTDGAAPEDIARVIGAFDQIQIQPEALLMVVEEWADRRLAALSPQALALALASFVRLGNHSPRLLQTAASCARSKATQMQLHELSTVLWAFARLEFDPGEELRVRAEHAMAASPADFADRELANLIWALARLGHTPSRDILSAICNGLLPIAAKTSAVSAALELWAFATFKYRPPLQLTTILGSAVAKELRPLDPLTIALSAWALGTLGVKHEAFAMAVAE